VSAAGSSLPPYPSWRADVARRRGLPDAPDVKKKVVDCCTACGRDGVAAAA